MAFVGILVKIVLGLATTTATSIVSDAIAKSIRTAVGRDKKSPDEEVPPQKVEPPEEVKTPERAMEKFCKMFEEMGTLDNLNYVLGGNIPVNANGTPRCYYKEARLSVLDKKAKSFLDHWGSQAHYAGAKEAEAKKAERKKALEKLVADIEAKAKEQEKTQQ